MGADRPSELVTTGWLAARLTDPNIIVVDASLRPVTQSSTGEDPRRDPYTDFLIGHIPGAVFLDINALSDAQTDLPHMLPRPEMFAAHVAALGLSSEAHIVVYDTSGLYSAPRAWWMLKGFGAKRVSILEGGLPRWRSEGRLLVQGRSELREARFAATPFRENIAQIDDVEKASVLGSSQILDARSALRFRGDSPEPRRGLRSGHIPGSFNLPFEHVVEDGCLLAPVRLRCILQRLGIDLNKPIITTCGSGVTAAILTFALATLGKKDVALFDGSWCEWAQKKELSNATGAARYVDVKGC